MAEARPEPTPGPVPNPASVRPFRFRARRRPVPWGIVTGLLLAAVLGSGCSASVPAVDRSPGERTADGCSEPRADTLRVAVKYTVPLFGFRDQGVVEGFDADMAREVARRLGRRLVFMESRTHDREDLLQRGCADVVFSTYSVTPERRELVDFSHVYWTARQVFLLGRNDRVPFATSNVPDDVHEAVCTTREATSVNRFRKLLPEVTLMELDKFSDCFKLLQRHLTRPGEKHPGREGLGRETVVAVIGDDAFLRGFLLEDPNRLKLSGVSGRPLSLEHYAAGLAKGSPMLADVNRAIDAMKADGAWLRICRTWIAPVTGSCPEPPPANPPLGQL